jgi:S-adenosylmethionine decarboxylase
VNVPATDIGGHILADLFGVEAVTLSDGIGLERLLRRAAADAGAHVLSSHFHSFGGKGGVTGVVLLAESHISIHTWPETGLAAMDIFMCGSADARRALAVVTDALSPTHRHIECVARGRPG